MPGKPPPGNGDPAKDTRPPDRFRRTRRLVWVMSSAAIGLSVAVIAFPSPEAAQVVTVVAPALLGLAGAFAGITNWAEVRKP